MVTSSTQQVSCGGGGAGGGAGGEGWCWWQMVVNASEGLLRPFRCPAGRASKTFPKGFEKGFEGLAGA